MDEAFIRKGMDMRQIVVSTETNNDMPEEFLAANGVCVIPHYYNVEKQVYGEEGNTISVKEFYDEMRAGKKVGTAASNPAVILEKFTEIAKQGKDITKLFYYKNGLKKAVAKIILPIAMKKHAAIEPSMLQDLKNKKPCEIEAINGVVCEWGRKMGIATPVNDRIVEVVKKQQAGELPLSKENMKLFEDLL